MAVAALAISAVAAVGATADSASLASKQASTAAQIANYNANVDIANAQQSALNAQANITAQRKDNSTYNSSQRAALAASGVLADTGSPMALQAETVGREEQKIQQEWTSEQISENTQYAAAQLGVLEGADEATAYHLQGAADIFQGIGSVANTVSAGYKSGVLGGSSPSPSSAEGNGLF